MTVGGGLLGIYVLRCSGGWGAAKPQAVSRSARFFVCVVVGCALIEIIYNYILLLIIICTTPL